MDTLGPLPVAPLAAGRLTYCFFANIYYKTCWSFDTDVTGKNKNPDCDLLGTGFCTDLYCFFVCFFIRELIRSSTLYRYVD